MRQQPENIADPPTQGDALSDILESIHLRGGMVRETTSATSARAYDAGTTLVHLVTRGQAHVETGDGERTLLPEGSMALLARGDQHAVQPRAEATWISGRFHVDRSIADPLLSVLPPVIVVAEPSIDWLPLSVDLLLSELRPSTPGSRAMISRILELLFIHGLRAWTASEGAKSPGGLTAALDPALSPALAAIHAAPAERWEVTRLAGIAHLSRSAFAARFTEQMGIPPSSYVQQYRLQHAATLLLTTQDSVSAVAHAAGYASEASFSRAFAAQHGQPPRRWRVGQRAQPEGPAH